MPIEDTKTILLVEDESILAMSEKISLEQYGYSVVIAITGEEAVDTVKSTPGIELILMDINLGDGMDGTQAAEIILKDHDIPILFLSSHIEPEIVEKTESISSYGYVVKSSSITVIDASIKMAFKLFNAHKEIDEQNKFIKLGNENLNVTIQELETSRNRLTSVFRAAPVGIGVLVNRIFVEVNQRICEMTGFTEEELVGKSSRILYPTEQDFNFVGKEKYAQIRRKGTGTVETQWKCKNGKSIDVLLSSTPLDTDDLKKGVTFTALNITERIQAEKALKESEEARTFLMDGVPSLLAYLDPDFKFVYMNQAHADWYGKEKVALIGRSLGELLPKEIYNRALPNYHKVLKGEIVTFKNKTCDREGNEKYLDVRLLPHLNDGKVIGFFAALNDITEYKKTVDSMRETTELLNATQQIAKIGGWTFDLEKQTMHWTKETYDLHGFEPETIKPGSQAHTNESIKCYEEKDRPEIMAAFKQCVEKGIPYDLDFPFTPVNRPQIWIRTVAKAEFENGKIVRVIGSIMDITDRKKAQEEIQKQLTEKETLLKEVHHRIKNNITSIENLLLMQLQSIRNPEAVYALQDAIARVQSMRIIYEKLLISDDYEEVSVKEYTKQLIDAIATVFSRNGKVKIEKQIADFNLNINTLIPLGIIINELLTNTFKYAFKKEGANHISIVLEKSKNYVIITVQDNGYGIDKGFDLNKSSGFGLTIVRILTEQLGGTFTIENHDGTRSVLKFPDLL